MARILDGQALAKQLRSSLADELRNMHGSPHIVVVLSYPDPASQIYVKHKLLACQEVGIRTTVLNQEYDSTSALLAALNTWNNNEDIDGILVQFPLHPNVDQSAIMQHICPEKDIDGVHPDNLGKLVMEDSSGFVPCTPLGIQTLLSSNDIFLPGKHVVIIGRSVTVGKSLALLLSQKNSRANATVTLAHSATDNLPKLCKSADIIIAAAGCPHLVTRDMVHEKSIVIDVGINRRGNDGNSRLIGDVDFESVSKVCAAISPVPGGVGPMTIASLLQNSVKSFRKRV